MKHHFQHSSLQNMHPLDGPMDGFSNLTTIKAHNMLSPIYIYELHSTAAKQAYTMRCWKMQNRLECKSLCIGMQPEPVRKVPAAHKLQLTMSVAPASTLTPHHTRVAHTVASQSRGEEADLTLSRKSQPGTSCTWRLQKTLQNNTQ
jgi:hypothetical protein